MEPLSLESMATENGSNLKISWALGLMTLIAASLIGTGITLWRAESTTTDARLDQVWTEIKGNETVANTDHYRLGQAEIQITGLQAQILTLQNAVQTFHEADQKEFDDIERKSDNQQNKIDDLDQGYQTDRWWIQAHLHADRADRILRGKK